MARAASAGSIRIGLRSNLSQFALLVAVNALVGGMLGRERTILPLLATDVFGLSGVASALTFVVAFGLAKAATNLAPVPWPTGSAGSRSSSGAGSSACRCRS